MADEKARADRARDIALFRYSLVHPAADAALTKKQRGALMRELAATVHRGVDGQEVRVSRSTLDRWLRDWRAGGFDALLPSARQSTPRLPAATLELAVALKKEVPERTAAQVRAVMAATGVIAPSQRTLQRHFAAQGLNTAAAPTAVFGRFEAEAPNQLWVGDALHGPTINGRKAILFAFEDDHTRLITGYRWVRREDTIRMEIALRAGIQARGVPNAVYVDNGSPFVDGQLIAALARLGVRLRHSKPHRPQGRGKIERFFRTVRDAFLVEIGSGRELADMTELNRYFTAWVETAYHQRKHSETGQSPLERWEAGWASERAAGRSPRLATPGELHEAFLWSQTRQVTKTATVSLLGNTYEVDAHLAGRSVELVFDPFDLTDITVRYDGRA